MLKKGDKVIVNNPSANLFNSKGKIVGKVVAKNLPISSRAGMRTGDWWLVDFGGYDGLTKVYQDYSVKSEESRMRKRSEAENLLGEALGPTKKPTLKKEANENLSQFSLKSCLSVS